MEERDYTPLLSLLVGAIVGVGIGLMLAPKSGKELRKDLGDMAARGKEQIGTAAGKAVEEGKKMYERAKGGAESAAERGKSAVEEIKKSAA